MSLPSAPSAVRRSGALLLADISGYTSFLQGVADAHHELIVEAPEPPPAYAVLSHLLDTIVANLGPTFRLVKFEGDAVFAVSEDDAPDGEDVLATIRRCYAAFRERLAAAGEQWVCTCDACRRVGDLDLKFVLHHGAYVAQSISGREELLGPAVNVVHRLLKNRARELVGDRPYALLTDSAIGTLALPTPADAVRGEERDPDAGTIGTRIVVLA